MSIWFLVPVALILVGYLWRRQERFDERYHDELARLNRKEWDDRLAAMKKNSPWRQD